MQNPVSRLLLPALLCLATVAASAQGFNLKAPIAAQPAFLTSVGQSTDVELVKVLLDRAGIPYKADGKAQATALVPSGAKSLVLAIGGSTKSLVTAGISVDAELARAKAVIAEARKLGMKIIGLHVGGAARRGELSDKFVVAATPLCDYVIVVADGNQDGLFTKLCGKSTLDTVDKISKADTPLAKAFIP
jgi:hypothetical protein